MSGIELQEAASFKTESAEGYPDKLPNLKNLSIEKMLKTREVQAVENLIEKQLRKK